MDINFCRRPPIRPRPHHLLTPPPCRCFKTFGSSCANFLAICLHSSLLCLFINIWIVLSVGRERSSFISPPPRDLLESNRLTKCNNFQPDEETKCVFIPPFLACFRFGALHFSGPSCFSMPPHSERNNLPRGCSVVHCCALLCSELKVRHVGPAPSFFRAVNKQGCSSTKQQKATRQQHKS